MSQKSRMGITTNNNYDINDEDFECKLEQTNKQYYNLFGIFTELMDK